jgi:hypothetical protein
MRRIKEPGHQSKTPSIVTKIVVIFNTFLCIHFLFSLCYLRPDCGFLPRGPSFNTLNCSWSKSHAEIPFTKICQFSCKNTLSQPQLRCCLWTESVWTHNSCVGGSRVKIAVQKLTTLAKIFCSFPPSFHSKATVAYFQILSTELLDKSLRHPTPYSFSY